MTETLQLEVLHVYCLCYSDTHGTCVLTCGYSFPYWLAGHS